MTSERAVAPNYRKRIEYVTATQMTQAVIDAIVLDGAALPKGVRLAGSWAHPGRREVYRAELYVDRERIDVRLAGSWAHPGRREVYRAELYVDRERIDVGDWVTVDTEGYTAYWPDDIFHAVFEPLPETQRSSHTDASDKKEGL